MKSSDESSPDAIRKFLCLTLPRIDFVPYPAEFQRTVIFAAGLASNTKAAEASRAFIQVLSGSAALPVIKAKCMEPG
jgi:hypothetical protein